MDRTVLEFEFTLKDVYIAGADLRAESVLVV